MIKRSPSPNPNPNSRVNPSPSLSPNSDPKSIRTSAAVGCHVLKTGQVDDIGLVQKIADIWPKRCVWNKNRIDRKRTLCKHRVHKNAGQRVIVDS